MRYTLVVLSFALQLLAAPVSRDFTLEKRTGQLEARFANAEADPQLIHYPSGSSGDSVDAPQLVSREAEAMDQLTHDTNGETSNSVEGSINAAREVQAESRATVDSDVPGSPNEPQQFNDRREAAAWIQDGIDNDESNFHPTKLGDKRSPSPAPTNRDGSAFPNNQNTHKGTNSIRSIYNSMVGTIEALRARGFSSSQLLEPN